MKEVLLKILSFVGWAYWIEIKTEMPRCTYYFGPFIGEKEAHGAKAGYIEDLEQENAQNITVVVKRCKPNVLTVFDEAGEHNLSVGHFSGQPS